MALYKTFLDRGVATWETVVNALVKSSNGKIADEVKIQLVKDYPNNS